MDILFGRIKLSLFQLNFFERLFSIIFKMLCLVLLNLCQHHMTFIYIWHRT